jgi:hypothetical protein
MTDTMVIVFAPRYSKEVYSILEEKRMVLILKGNTILFFVENHPL